METGLQQNAAFIRGAYRKAVRGVRIRCSGVAFNLFGFSPEAAGVEDDMYMGVRMIRKMVELVNYQSAFGVNAPQILLKEGQMNEA